MCKCTPGIRTPFCGQPGCEWPNSKPEGAREAPASPPASPPRGEEGDPSPSARDAKTRLEETDLEAAVLVKLFQYENGLDCAGDPTSEWFASQYDAIKRGGTDPIEILLDVCAKFTSANGNRDVAEEFLRSALQAAPAAHEAKPKGPSPSSSPTPAPQGAQAGEDLASPSQNERWLLGSLESACRDRDALRAKVETLEAANRAHVETEDKRLTLAMQALESAQRERDNAIAQLRAHPPAPASPGGLDLEAAFWVLLDKARLSPDVATAHAWIDRALAQANRTSPAAPPPRSLEARPLDLQYCVCGHEAERHVNPHPASAYCEVEGCNCRRFRAAARPMEEGTACIIPSGYMEEVNCRKCGKPMKDHSGIRPKAEEGKEGAA